MTRPRQHAERIQINARLPKALHELLVSAAELRQVSANYLIEVALTDYLTMYDTQTPAPDHVTAPTRPSEALPPRSLHWPHEPIP